MIAGGIDHDLLGDLPANDQVFGADLLVCSAGCLDVEHEVRARWIPRLAVGRNLKIDLDRGQSQRYWASCGFFCAKSIKPPVVERVI